MRIAAVTLLAVLSSLCAASAAEPFKYVSPQEAAQLTSKVAGHIGNNFLYRKDAYLQELVYRDGNGEVETHAVWTDHMVVVEGRGTLVLGGTVTGEHEIRPGEKRGTSSRGGKEYAMVPGVTITVPAGIPHWTMVKPGEHLRLVVFKLKD